ncbi:MAG: recombination mediator RecR [Patescibacteria group bacterium]|nr:recombination mediator RecR [Patescibacteria group bacterium]
MDYPKSIQNLIMELTRWPSVGPKTAERYVFYLLNQSPERLQRLAQSIAELKEKIIICRNCGAVSETNPCFICKNKQRNQALLCIVANTRDMLSIESTGIFNGRYHILGGVINAINKIGPEKLNIKSLQNKIENNNIKEIIIALSPNMEGEGTAIYLNKLLKSNDLKITRIARGLPSGSELEYADEMTLGNALKFRTDL